MFIVADAVKTKIMCNLTPNLNFDDSGKNAFYFVVEFEGRWLTDYWILFLSKRQTEQGISYARECLSSLL